MKVLILHNSGNVGKSLIAREVFYQNFTKDDRMLLELESRNASSSSFNINVERIDFSKQSALQDITRYSIIYDDFILDIGSSEIKDFLVAIEKTREIIDEFDLVIIPAIQDQKIIPDTKKTMMVVRALGAEEKMRVVFNKIKNPSTIEEDFESLYEWARKEKFAMDSELYLKDYTEATSDLIKFKLLSSELLSDETDYKSQVIQYHKKGEMEKSRNASNRLLAQRISKSLHGDVQELFAKIKNSMGRK